MKQVFLSAIVMVLGVLIQCSQLVGQVERALNGTIQLENDVVTGSLFGLQIVDFPSATIKDRFFDELATEMEDKDKAKKLLNRFMNNEDCIGLAIFLNQKYPEKKFAPISLPILIAESFEIPIDFWSGGGKFTHVVRCEQFGIILYEYWIDILDLAEDPIEQQKNKATGKKTHK